MVKALSLFINLTEAKLSSKSSSHFFPVFETFINSLPFELTKLLPEDSIRSLVKLFFDHEGYFTDQQQFQIHTWYLQYYIVNLIKTTDDPYLFNRACQFITNEFNENYLVKKQQQQHDEINSLPSENESMKNENVEILNAEDPFYFSDDMKRLRLNVILLCLKTCYHVYLRSGWTKQPIESLFLHVTQRRLLIPYEDIREQLDNLNTDFTQKQRKRLSGNGGAVQTIRTYNSTAHPLRTKKVGILR